MGKGKLGPGDRCDASAPKKGRSYAPQMSDCQDAARRGAGSGGAGSSPAAFSPGDGGTEGWGGRGPGAGGQDSRELGLGGWRWMLPAEGEARLWLAWTHLRPENQPPQTRPEPKPK